MRNRLSFAMPALCIAIFIWMAFDALSRVRAVFAPLFIALGDTP